jgi:glycosyltransferase involved in cell wall biosynthesis
MSGDVVSTVCGGAPPQQKDAALPTAAEGAPRPTAPCDELVTVVIPAHNAASTICQTLRSVSAQSHGALQVVVVDDGSTDDTAQVVENHARSDARVCLIRQPNRGVAAARNAALAAAEAAFVAPIDADDIWHPQKIQKQLAAMHEGGPNVGLVYSWSVILDEQGRATRLAKKYTQAGEVLASLCESNLVGNGSSPLMRTDAVRQAGGYDASLFEARAQGCEDWALYLEIAAQSHFGLVPEYLTGYRRAPNSMSSDFAQMWRSNCLVAHKLLARRPDLARHLRQGMSNMCHTVYVEARAAGNEALADEFLKRLVFTMPYHATKFFVYAPCRQRLRALRAGASSLSEASAAQDLLQVWPND